MAKPNKTKRTVIRWTKRIALIASALGLVALIVRALLPQAIVVDTAVVRRGPLEVEVREDGQTRVRDRYVIAAPITGELERVTIDPGTMVEPSTIVARIQPPHAALLDDRSRAETTARLSIARARERAATAAVSRARQAKLYATNEARRTRALVAGGALSGAERERADIAEQLAIEDLAAAEHQRAGAASEIQALRAVLEPGHRDAKPFEVGAPTRGRVLRILRESAGPVTAGTPLLEVGDPSQLEVVIDVLSRDAERIEPGMKVEIQTAAASPISAIVTTVEPSAFTRISALGVEEQRVNVIACLDGAHNLGDAFRVDARIITWRGEDVLRIPASALFRDHGRWAVYVVEDGRARTRPVEVGHRGRVEVEITRGLGAGEHIILYPNDQIHDAARVSLRTEAAR